MFRLHTFALTVTLLFSSINAEEIDVAIIGGGVTGTYSAWKLSQQENADPQNIHIFEATDRIGGRLYTVFFPEMQNIPVELGGMRFRGSHTRVHQLANTLGLTIVPFASSDSDNLYYLRGVRLRKSELTDTTKLPYKLAEHEQGKSPSDIMMNVIRQIVPNADTLTKEEWHAIRDTLTYKGQLLKDISWINFLSSTLSSEAFQLLSDVGDIYLMGDVSALSQLNLWIASSFGGVYKIAEGYQAIPLRLMEEFKASGGHVHTNHKLISIAQTNGAYELTFVTQTGETVKSQAKKVILTLAPTALLKLLPNTPFADNDELIQNLQAVTPNVLTKLFLAYPHPWWRTLGLKDGHTGTSLTIRGMYYFPSEEDFSQDGDNKNALLLASYQGSFLPFWRSLNNSKPFRTRMNDLQKLIPGENLVLQAQHQLKEVHGLDDIPEPIMAAFQDWSQAPYYAAFYFWNVGADPTQVEKQVRKPLTDNDIYIFTAELGEEQGWVESTLETSDRLLKEHFGVK